MNRKKIGLLKIWITALGVVLLGLMGVSTVSAAGLHENDPMPCYDISGKGVNVLVGGVANSGVMDFDFSTTFANPALLTYEACVRMKADKITPDHLEGWVWNDNLGWISLYCSGGLNLAAGCGAVNYGIAMNVTGGPAPNFATVGLGSGGGFSGYGWGDNVGYISFNCAAHAGCGVSNYGIQLTPSGAAKGFVDTVTAGAKYIWADSVGWFDLSSVKFPWFASVAEDLMVCSSKDPGCTCDLAKACDLGVGTNVPYADNVEKITLTLPFKDPGTGTMIAAYDTDGTCTAPNMTDVAPGVNAYKVCFNLIWEDKVSFDQTSPASQSDSNAAGAGPVTKPANLAAFVNDAVNGNKYFDVTSKAPTSDQNVDIKMKFRNEKFFKDETAPYAYDYDSSLVTNGSNNTLKLLSVKYYIYKYRVLPAATGVCILGVDNGGKCNPKEILNVPFSFRPLAFIDNLVQVKGDKNLIFIDGAESDPLSFSYSVVNEKNLTSLVAKLMAGIVNDTYELDTNFALTVNSGGENKAAKEQVANLFSGNGQIAGLIERMADAQEGTSPTGTPFMFTEVSYKLGNDTIKFFSAKLPRVKAGSLKNPVMKSVGSVYSAASIFNKGGQTTRSQGSVAVNQFRTQINKAVSRFLAGGSLAGGSGEAGVSVAANSKAFSAMYDLKDSTGKIYYFKNRDVRISCNPSGNNTCDWVGSWTFVVENGNIFIDSNLVPADTSARLGLIAFKDVTKPLDYSKGNIYVESAVTDMYANMFADGAFMSYAKSKGVNNKGEPKFLDDYERQDLLKNQLYIMGTLSSNNCIGCASAAKPFDALGKAVVTTTGSFAQSDSQEASGRARAKLADLNFLRYYGPSLEICDGSEGPGAVEGVPKDQYFNPVDNPDETLAAGGGCNPNFVGSQAYEIEDYLFAGQDTAYLGDLVAGNDAGAGLKSKKYTNDSTKNDPVYFEYRSADGVKLFEKEVDVTPLQ